MQNSIRENKNVIMWEEDGILYAVYKKNSIIDLPAAEELIKLRLSISLGRSYPVLIDIRNIGNVTKQAREYLASDEACKEMKKAAIIIDSNFSKILINIFFGINKPVVAGKAFTDKTSAEKWLREDSETDKSVLGKLSHIY